ncbi:SGNH/GDSL hydrolase family protein [Candidatus Woesearchaeota archaeon]|nr:SGNH/GDSL hydrolase family protein [Candidatus Woesearchaeota archaeon]
MVLAQFIKNGRKEFLLLVVSLLISLIIIEIILRIAFPPIHVHTKYGWAWDKPFLEYKTVDDDINNTRNITIAYYNNGFKRWGNASTSKIKIFIIGDSFTDMRFVSNGEEWYADMEKEFDNIELFVYGAGGFGSLQEYMILDSFIDIIKPDAILWQFYFNDFINNDYEADLGEYPFNNHGYRPYLQNGKIVYRLPLPLGRYRDKSRIFDLLMDSYDAVQRNMWVNGKKDIFYSRVYGHEFWKRDFSDALIWKGKFGRTLNTTDKIFALVKVRSGNTPIYLFSADDRLKKYEEYISFHNNITYIPGLTKHMENKIKEGVNPYVINDRHWNFAGNRIVGEYLVSYFKGHKISEKLNLDKS